MLNKTWRVLCVSAVLLMIGGCVPEDSLEWSPDGSVGLLRAHGALYLVDGESGALTAIEEKDVQPWPGISGDGKQIVYARRVEIAGLEEGLKSLSAEQVAMIESAAAQMRKDITAAGGLVEGKFPEIKQGPLAAADNPIEYCNWVIRYVCEKNADEIAKIVGDGLQKGKEKKLSGYQLVIVGRDNLGGKKVLATSVLDVRGLKFSPNGQYVAYLMHEQRGQSDKCFTEESLYVTAAAGDGQTVLVDHPVAVGFGWRSDSRAMVYLKAEAENLANDDLIAGVVIEKIVSDEKGQLVSTPQSSLVVGSASKDREESQSRQIAGVMFQPWMKAMYGPDEHVFFSSTKFSVPTSDFEGGKWSLFCFDPVTKGLIETAPKELSADFDLPINCFSLSNDGRKVILPMPNNRLAIYKLGDTTATVPIEADEGFGEKGALKLAPAWKGDRGITCLVSEKSHFLKGKQAHRSEIVVINDKGELVKVLSESWPDEVLDKIGR